MRAPSTRLLRDVVIVSAPGTERDGNGGTLVNRPGDPGPALACSVQEVTTGKGTTYDPGPAPFGRVDHELAFASDPGIARSGQQITWTEHKGRALDPPRVLRSAGPARPPRGLGERWTASATFSG